MGYVYAAMWAVIAVYLFFTAKKVNKILYLIAGLFSFMAVWWLVNELIPVNLFEGIYGIIFRVIVGAVLVVLIVIYLISKKRKNEE